MKGAAHKPIHWNKTAWENALGQLPAVLAGDSFTRQDVTAIARDVRAGDHDSQWAAYLAAMILGYGRVGYGASRVKRMADVDGFSEALAELTRVTLEEGGAAGYRRVRDARYESPGDKTFLKHLGPAFGTKYIYFLTKAQPVAGRGVSPVLDSVVRTWFKQHAPEIQVQIGNGWGHAERYATYVSTMQEWGKQLDIPADDVERLIFACRKVDRGATWAEAWTGAPAADAEELLEALAVCLDELGLADCAQPHLEALAGQLSEAEDVHVEEAA